jgi:hypothetical protein
MILRGNIMNGKHEAACGNRNEIIKTEHLHESNKITSMHGESTKQQKRLVLNQHFWMLQRECLLSNGTGRG